MASPSEVNEVLPSLSFKPDVKEKADYADNDVGEYKLLLIVNGSRLSLCAVDYAMSGGVVIIT